MLPRLFNRSKIPQPFISSSLTRFRNIDEGFGVTLSFLPPTPRWYGREDPKKRHLIRHAGTRGLITCVGVYFSLGADRCFVAHITALVLRQRFAPWGRDVKDADEAWWYKESTKQRLKQFAKFNGWKPEDHKSEILRSLIIACPDAKGRTGEFVVEGIKEFLGIEDDVQVHTKSGFIVEHPGGERLMLSYDQEGSKASLPPPELARYTSLMEVEAEKLSLELRLVPGMEPVSFLMP